MDAASLLPRSDAHALVSLSAEMVPIPSPNGQEQVLAEWLVARLTAMGLDVAVCDVCEGRPNVIATLRGKDRDTIGLLFHGQLDTASALSMPDPFSGRLVEGSLWGRGSVDQKGGLAAALAAFGALAKIGPLRKSVALAAVIDEESEHRGSYALVEDGLKAKAPIVRALRPSPGSRPQRHCASPHNSARQAGPWLHGLARHQCR